LIAKANEILKKANVANIPVIYVRFETTNWIMNMRGGNDSCDKQPHYKIVTCFNYPP
jgi:hypothetical protein